MPMLEHHQLPEAPVMVALAGEMLVDKTPHELRLEVPALQRARREQRIREEAAKVAAEPDLQRDAESLLRPVEDAFRKQRRRNLLEHVLSPAVADLECIRER